MRDLFSSDDLLDRAEKLFAELDSMSFEDRIEMLNALRLALHRHSPFSGEPVDCVIWVPVDTVAGNDYNPNTVAPPEMRLLQRSISADGYTQPVVTFDDPRSDGRQHTVIDGFHRTRVGKECAEVRKRLHGYLPITTIKDSRQGINDRMAATIRHNRARGVHGVLPMTDIVASLIRDGWSDTEVARELGMDADEVLRFKQTSGLPSLFANHDYSKSWE